MTTQLTSPVGEAEESVEVKVDTGFSGWIALSKELIRKLELPRI